MFSFSHFILFSFSLYCEIEKMKNSLLILFFGSFFLMLFLFSQVQLGIACIYLLEFLLKKYKLFWGVDFLFNHVQQMQLVFICLNFCKKDTSYCGNRNFFVILQRLSKSPTKPMTKS